MKRLGRVLIVLGILAALLVGAEFALRAVVNDQAQKALGGTDLQLEQPTMVLGGGSVLAAVAQGRFVDVSGTAQSAIVPFEGHRVPVRAITYRASDIRLLSTSSAVIGRADLTGTLGWSSLSEVAGLPIAHGGDGRLLVTYRADVLGLNSVDIGISGVPVLDAAKQEVELQQARIDVAGVQLTETLSQQIIDRVVRPIPLGTDDRVRVTAVRVAADGLVADLTATELPVQR